MSKLIQPSFAGGEVSPDVAARVDLSKRAVAVEKAENFTVKATGGMESRAGMRFVGQAKYTLATRIIPFEFNSEQTYIIEVGPLYMRFYRDGGQILAAGNNPYEIATPYAEADLFDLDFAQSGDVMTIVHPDYAPRELVRISDTNWTLTEITFAPSIAAPSDLNVTVNFQQGGVITDVTLSDPAVVTSANHGLPAGARVFITVIIGPSNLNGNVYSVTPLSADTFRLEGSDTSSEPAYVSGGIWRVSSGPVRYKVTAVSAATGEESQAGLFIGPVPINAISKANPAVLDTTVQHRLVDGDEIYITGVGGMTELNNRRFIVSVVDPNTVKLYRTDRSPVDSTGYGTYTSGGFTYAARTWDVTAEALSWDHTIEWSEVAGAASYNVYRSFNDDAYGLIGRTAGLNFNDDFIAADFTVSPPSFVNPFEEGDNYWPSTTGFFQQRQVYANSIAYPNRFWISQTGAFYNFGASSPVKDDDAIVGSLAAREVNEIRSLIPLSDLVMMTSVSEFRVKGAGDSPFTPSTINIKPQSFYGSTALRPIVVGDLALYMAHGNFIRELSYQFSRDNFSGRDLTVLARHLLDGQTIVDWGFAPSPYALLWLIRDDGVALVLTYQNEQEVYAWTRATTLGKFKSVAVVREGSRDVPYFVIERNINGTVKQFVERLDERDFTDLQDAFCVDAGLSLDVPITIENMTAANPVVVTATGHALQNGDTVDISDVLEVSDKNTRQEIASDDYTGTGFTVANRTGNTFELYLNGSGYDGSGFAAYSSGGVARKAVTTVSGLSHLEGAEVVAAANGYAETGLVVSSGSVTLSAPASRIHVGLPYTCQMVTLPISTYGSANTVDKRTMNISRLTVQVERSMGLWTGPSTDQMREAKFGLPAAYGQPLPMVTEDINVTLKADWSKEKRVVLEQRSPLPLTVLSITPDISVGGN